MSLNIFICGVGGQGLVLLTSVIGDACAKSGKKIITGEMYGLSQRSGTVSVHLRIGEDAFSPLIPYGEADIIIALEAIEALRYIEYLKKDGIILMNKRIMHPPIETSKIITSKGVKIHHCRGHCFEIEELDNEHRGGRRSQACPRERKRKHGEHSFSRMPIDARDVSC